MTVEPDLLPLPEGAQIYGRDEMRAYARANLAQLQAENERLRAEVAEWKRVAAAQAELHDEAEARADRMAEALRGMLAEYEALHAKYDLGECQATVDARAAIQDQEDGND